MVPTTRRFRLGGRRHLWYLLGVLLVSPAHVRAQIDPCLEDPATCYGEWTRHYQIIPNPPGIFNGEIAHAMYLPPHQNGSSVYTGKVFFITARGCCDPMPPGWCDTNGTRVFRWDPDTPQAPALQIDVPNNPGGQPTQDFFCSGHAFLETGDLVVAGGVDSWTTGLSHCGCPSGSQAVWLWNASPTGPSPLQWIPLGTMPSRRYYPFIVELGTPDGDLMIAGSGCAPNSPAEENNQVLDATTLTLGTQIPNSRVDGSCVPLGSNADLAGYPWLFQLATPLQVSGQTRYPVFFAGPAPTKYFKDACTNPDQWRDGMPTGPACPPYGPTYLSSRSDGSPVHYLSWDSSGGGPGVRRETIYAMGGDFGATGPDCSPNATATMDRIRDPGPTTCWEPVASMAAPRIYCNAVPLPDGTFLVVGGKRMGLTECEGVKTPELYCPSENPGAWLAPNTWTPLASQGQVRGYHSVAFLLLDGRVVSAGGRSWNCWCRITCPSPPFPANTFGLGCVTPNICPCPPQIAEHSVEIFSPPYLFWGPRPSILVCPQNLSYGGGTTTFSMTAELGNDLGISKVTLVRPASVTHHVDFNQRFVELRIESQQFINVEGLPTQAALTVRLPENRWTCPPGWYMIFAISSEATGNRRIPSVGRWVHIE